MSGNSEKPQIKSEKYDYATIISDAEYMRGIRVMTDDMLMENDTNDITSWVLVLSIVAGVIILPLAMGLLIILGFIGALLGLI